MGKILHGHFRVGIDVVRVFVRFQLVLSTNDTSPRSPFSEKSPDMTRLVELAKVQIIGAPHSRHLVTEWLHRQLYLNPRTKGLTLRFHLFGCHAAL
jgi:hypothetical protein